MSTTDSYTTPRDDRMALVERTLIGAVVRDHTKVAELAALGITPSCFFAPNSRPAAEVAFDAYARGEDFSAADMLEAIQDAAPQTATEAWDWLQAATIEAIAADIPGDAAAMLAAARERAVRDAMTQAQLDFLRGTPIAQVVATQRDALDAAEHIGADGVILNGADAAQKMWGYIRAAAAGDTGIYATGFPGLDNHIGGGIKRGNITTIAARPGTGKTAMGLALARNLANDGTRVLYANLELPEDELLARYYAGAAGVPYSAMLSGRLDATAISMLQDAMQDIADSGAQDRVAFSGKDATYAVSDLRRAVLRHKADVLIIDYIGLIAEPDLENKPNQYEVLTAIMRRIKALTRTLNVAVVLLAQTNREAESRANKAPIMADIKGSGQIEQDSANIIMLSNAEENDSQQPEREIMADIIKARNGTPGQVVLCADFARASVWEQPIGGVV